MTDVPYRFDIDLYERGENFYEISYLDLIRDQLPSAGKDTNSLSPNGNLNGSNHLDHLAKYFENKYGPLVTMKSKYQKKKVCVNDFVDPGEGYDCQDSFIDDTEADNVALAPDEMTKRGGFYVNKKSLTKIVVQQDILEPPAKRKKSENSGKFTPPKKNKSKQLLNKAVRCLSTSKKLKQAENEKQKMPHLESTFDEVLSESSNAKHSTPLSKQNGLSSESIDKLSTLDATKPLQTAQNPQDSTNNTGDLNDSSTTALSESTCKPSSNLTTPPVLPEISNEIKIVVEKIKKYTEDLPQKDNKRFFCPEVDDYLLQLDTELNNPTLSKPLRAAIYNYLDHFIPTKKSSLQRRIRKLKEDSETKKLAPMIQKLKMAIKEAMPQLLQRHDQDVKAYHIRLSAWQEEVQKLNATKEMVVDITNEDGSPKFVPTSPKKPPKPNMPKRSFSFQKPEIRNVFNQIIMCKMEAYYKLNVSKSSEEDYLKKFLHDTLLPLWPDYWMTVGQLWKNSHTAYERFKINMSSQKTPNFPAKCATPLSANNTNKINKSSSHHTSTPTGPKLIKTPQQQPQHNATDSKSVKVTTPINAGIEVIRGSAEQDKGISSICVKSPIDNHLLEGLQKSKPKSKEVMQQPPAAKIPNTGDVANNRSFDDVFKQVLKTNHPKDSNLTVNTSFPCSEASFLTPNKSHIKQEKQLNPNKTTPDNMKGKNHQSPNLATSQNNNFNSNPTKSIVHNSCPTTPKGNHAPKMNHQHFSNLNQSNPPTKFNQTPIIQKPVSPSKPKSPNKPNKPIPNPNNAMMNPVNGNNLSSNQKQACQPLPSMFEITNHFNHQPHKPRDYQFSPSTSSYINRPPPSHPSYRNQQQLYTNISPNSNMPPSPNSHSPIMQNVNKSFLPAMPAHTQSMVTGPPMQQNYSPLPRSFDHSGHWHPNQQVQSCSFPQTSRFPHSSQANPQVTDYSSALMLTNNMPYSNDHNSGLMIQPYMHMPQNIPGNYANSNIQSDAAYSNFK